MSKSILLTAFAPFQGESINPSEKLLSTFSQDPDLAKVIEPLFLPVSFQRAPEFLRKALLQAPYKYVFMMGQAGGRARICLERVALNWAETESADEDGYKPVLGPLFSKTSAAPALFTSLDLKENQKQLKQKSRDVEISLSAGAFVCNSLYYQALQSIAEAQLQTEACFIHVPYLPEQAVGKNTSQPSMAFETMRVTIKDFISLYL